MNAFSAICIQDYTLTALNGDTLRLERGKEYTVSDLMGNERIVFTNFWVKVPNELFAGILPLGHKHENTGVRR